MQATARTSSDRDHDVRLRYRSPPRHRLRRCIGEVPVQRRPTHSEVFGYIPRSVTVRPHPLCGRDVTGIGSFLGRPNLVPLARTSVRTANRPRRGSCWCDARTPPAESRTRSRTRRP
jgi:hypothetical protein